MDLFEYSSNKSFRLLNMYERLNKGEELHKGSLADEFGVSVKTIQRDIDELRIYFADAHYDEFETAIKYSRARDSYYLVRLEREWLTNTEALAVCKILLESRALNKEEMTSLLQKSTMQISPADKTNAVFFNSYPSFHVTNLL